MIFFNVKIMFSVFDVDILARKCISNTIFVQNNCDKN